MRRIGYGPDADPVARRVGEDILGRALRKVLTDAERRLLLDYLHGAPPEQLARQIGCPLERLLDLVAGLLERLRGSEYGEQLREELRDPHGPRHSREVWEGVAEVPVHRCAREGCHAPPFPQKATGRPRYYCSDRCKQAAYRERQRTPAAGTVDPAPRRPRGTHRYQLRDYSAPLAEFPRPRPQWQGYFKFLSASVASWYQRSCWHQQAQPVPATFRPTARRIVLDVPVLAGSLLGSLGKSGLAQSLHEARGAENPTRASYVERLLHEALGTSWPLAKGVGPADLWAGTDTPAAQRVPGSPEWFVLVGAPLPQMQQRAVDPGSPLISRDPVGPLPVPSPWWGPQLRAPRGGMPPGRGSRPASTRRRRRRGRARA
ncbi:hypothetical protein AB5J72_00020 [Streptomyces sp. CG1]|uniref:hypothetical protein n=1 Tax=Streptomyces sp. CG1 TaxID=1287523 RepID=UPI0034E1D6A8